MENKYWDLLEKLLDEAINLKYEYKRANRKKKSKFSASNAGYCGRATILNRLSADEAELTPKTKRVFWIGSIIHDELVRLLQKTKRLVASETRLDGHPDIIGRLDFIIQDDNGLNILYELKSVRTSSFWYKIVKLQKPHKHNVYQAITYWLLNNKYRLDKVKIAYFSKEDAALKVFNVNLTDELLAEVKEWWNKTKSNFTNKKLPSTFKKGSDEYKTFCQNCTFNELYCFGDKTIVKENIAKLEWDEEKNQSGAVTGLEKKEPNPVQSTQL